MAKAVKVTPVKQFFRFFREEFNGFFLYHLVTFANLAINDILEELIYQRFFQWLLPGETNFPIREDDIINLGFFAGMSRPLLFGQTTAGSIYLTGSNVINGVQLSHRGLFNMETERFVFVENTQNDIVHHASPSMRMSLVPTGQEVLGYVRYDTPLFREDGSVDHSVILSTPPSGGIPYSEWYGETFLTLERYYNQTSILPIELFKRLLECVQWIRYNKPNIVSFLEITEILGQGYITNIEIVPNGRYYIVFYSLDPGVVSSYWMQRLLVWEYVVAQKFKLFITQERQ